MTLPHNSDDRLEELLLEAALDPGVSTKELQAELRASGVDIDRILARAKDTVGTAVRERLRAAAIADRAAREQELATAKQNLAPWSVEQIRAWLRSVADGAFGAGAQALAQPCFRNRQSETMTDDELRNLAAEIKAAMGEKL